jgi:hypothetical protein
VSLKIYEMKKVLYGILFLIAIPEFYSLQAQVLSISPGTDLVIKQGTVFSADSLTLTPSADFTLSNISLGRSSTVSHSTVNPYIARVYQFSTNTNVFNGTIQISYQDGAELNGLAETDLQLNAHNGITWQAFASATNNTINNYVLTTSLPGLQLNELTLASVSGPLPLQWRSFTVAKQHDNVLLEWSTFAENNSKYFFIQTSFNGTTWNTIATVSAAGNSSSVRDYNYLHTSPAAGYNYYRVIETDVDSKYNYSLVRRLYFELTPWDIELLGNPVTNGRLEIKITLAGTNDIPPKLRLYTSDGRLLWTKKGGDGTQSLNVNGYPKGTYLLRANEKTIKFLIQ